MKNFKLSSVNFGDLENTATPDLPSGTTIGIIMNKVLTLVFPIAGIVVFFYLIYGGYQYLVSQGDPKAVQSAKQTLTYAIIGFLVVFSAYFVVKVLGLVLEFRLDKTLFG